MLRIQVEGVEKRTWKDVGALLGIGATAAAGGFAIMGASASLMAASAPAIPVLASGRGHDMFMQALGHMKGMAGSGRVDAFRNFAQQINTTTKGEWRAAEQMAKNGVAFAGDGRLLAFDKAGNMFMGKGFEQINAALNIQKGGGVVIDFTKLTPIK